jgi:DNA helicase-2/ATP-dependent DNA helicase PcrA
LEFPVVFIVGLEDGVFPHMRSLGSPEELEEERRLAYVGITRAKERLYLTNATSRSLYGRSYYNVPSRFLSELPEDTIEVSGDDEQLGSEPHYPNVSRASASWKIGQEVEHRRWGRGVIIGLEGAGEKAEATIHFPEEGEKRVVIAYAPLEPIE